jgi:hypothetical protein
MRSPESRLINGVTYTMTPLGATQGLSVATKLARVLGGGAKTPEKPLVGILESLNEADLTFLCTTFAKLTTFNVGDGKEPLLSTFFDEHFSASYDTLLQWLVFCLEVNYKSLFLGLGIDLTKISQLTAAPSGV